jgi:hypothetical protein
MRAVIGRTTTQNIKVSTTGSIIQSQTPITLKNQVTEIRSIEDINDVAEVDVVEGATLVYNPTNDKYEVKKLDASDLAGDINLDGGSF